ncbi:MAG: alpha/beta hydrolase [Planctomycetaceae bacterium]
MSDASAGTSAGAIVPPSRRRSRKVARAIFIYVFVPYFGLTAILGSFQRRLIYLPRAVSDLTPEQAGLPRGKVHAISTTTEDGLRLNGWHILPDGKTADDHGDCDRELEDGGYVVLYFYGNAGSRVRQVQDVRDFTSLGCHVFLFDYRGYGDNPGSPSETGLAADARAVWKYAVDERKLPHDRILLFGQSLGGAVATRLAEEASRQKTAPAGLIVNATFSSLTDAAQWHYPFLPVRLVLVDRYPSTDRIGKVTCPILVMHGDKDDIVPIAQGRKLFESAPAQSENGIPKRFVEFSNVGHNDVSHVLLSGAVKSFLAEIEKVK